MLEPRCEQAISEKTYLLIHGAYLGGWCWNTVAKLLAPAMVYTPTLIGISERASERTPSTGLDTHIQQITTFITENQLASVHLVGWSYGGLVISGVINSSPERISAATFLDAYLPENGQSAASFLTMPQKMMLQLAARLDKGIKPPRPDQWGITDEALLSAINDRITTQPPRTFTQKVAAPEHWPDHIDYSYLRCRDYAGSIFDQFYDKAKRDKRFHVQELECSHAAPLTHPSAVATAIVSQH